MLVRRWMLLAGLLFVCGAGLSSAVASPSVTTSDAKPRPAFADPSALLANQAIQASFDPTLQKYGYLHDVGRTIDEARDRRDVETLVMASLLLFRAEHESARKCPQVSAQNLLEEATTLAEVQHDPKALALVADLWGDEAFGPGDVARRQALLDEARDFTALGGSAHASCRLLIKNLSSHTAKIYAGDRYLGIIDPYDTRYVYVPTGATKLYARATCHPVEWGPNKYRLGSDFVWRLTP